MIANIKDYVCISRLNFEFILTELGFSLEKMNVSENRQGKPNVWCLRWGLSQQKVARRSKKEWTWNWVNPLGVQMLEIFAGSFLSSK